MLNHLCLKIYKSATFMCAVAPIKLETKGYDHITENLKLFPIFNISVEQEIHVLFES
jgi:hypothetical protein